MRIKVFATFSNDIRHILLQRLISLINIFYVPHTTRGIKQQLAPTVVWDFLNLDILGSGVPNKWGVRMIYQGSGYYGR